LSDRAIANLIATYAELIDAGDFPAVGALLADATFTGSSGSVRGQDAITRMFHNTVLLHEDGTPRTKHITTNSIIEVTGETATARSYFTVLQALPDLPLQPIASGRYHDGFALRSGEWRFISRHVFVDLVGDVSHHLRAPDSRLTRRIRRDFPEPGSADEILQLLAGLPDRSGSEALGTERVQAAIILCAQGDIGKLQQAVELSLTDWRDVLVAADLASEDWPAHLDQGLGPASQHGPH
jgi:ketosteroid isomerase-like protein